MKTKILPELHTLAIVLAAIQSVALAGAGENPDSSQADDLQALKDRVEKLETEQAESKLPSWLERWTFKGDFRYRAERMNEEGKDDRNRHRLRARIYAGIEVNEHTDFGMAISTGAEDPVSTNETIGEGWQRMRIGYDEAFVNYHPWNADHNGFNGAFIAGKMRTPFLQVTKSEMLWDSDVRPEGVAARFDGDVGNVNLFTNVGGFYLRENKSGTDTGMVGGQLGTVIPISSTKLTLGGGYYDFLSIQGADVFDWEYDNGDKSTANSRGNSSTAPDANGNRQYTEDYDLLELFANYGLMVSDEIPLDFFGNYVENTAVNDHNTGYLFGAKLGNAKKPYSWFARYQWKNLEADAIVGAFADSDFGGGGTDGKGGELNLGFVLQKNWWVYFSWFHNQVDISSTSRDYERFQLDFIWKF